MVGRVVAHLALYYWLLYRLLLYHGRYRPGLHALELLTYLRIPALETGYLC